MKYYTLEPEVAGGLGPNTVLDHTRHPPLVFKLHYEFDVWLGDELLESFPCYIVTMRLATVFMEGHFTGAEIAPIEVTTSDCFHEFCPGVTLPTFVWLKVCGAAGCDDFGITQDNLLVVSERVLEQLNLKHCDVAEFIAT